MYFENASRILRTLQQVEQSILLLLDWNKDLQSADDFLVSPEGMKNLAASCMLVEAIGEAYRKIDKGTEASCCRSIRLFHGKL